MSNMTCTTIWTTKHSAIRRCWVPFWNYIFQIWIWWYYFYS